jgi:teichuronic acid biosynthesis glycosyltransferase TuaC
VPEIAGRAGQTCSAPDPATAEGRARYRILTFTSLYPNDAQPRHGIFVEQRLRQLVASDRVELRVVAPVPWFPWRHPRFGRYAQYARAAHDEVRHGVSVCHPRYPSIPKIGMTLAPFLLAAATAPTLRGIIKDGYDFDLIDAHYFYPDGVAAVMLGRRLGRPVVVTARGSDINLIARHRAPAALIRWAARNAAGLVTVSQALKEILVVLGVSADKITVLRNGVDLELFYPVEREAERRRLGLTDTTLISVGNLVEGKGHDVVIKALTQLPQMTLLVVGEGPQERALKTLAQTLGVTERVRFLGNVTQQELRCYYTAADVLVLASASEGWPNVLLEAMACGTPVIATRVGGIPEIVAAGGPGILVDERTPESISAAVRALAAGTPDRAHTRNYAEQFSWNETTQGQVRLIERVLRQNKGAR